MPPYAEEIALTVAVWNPFRSAQINRGTGSPSAEHSNICSTCSSCEGSVPVTLQAKQGGTYEPGNASVGWPVLKKYTLPWSEGSE